MSKTNGCSDEEGMIQQANPYGALLRRRRVTAGLSLREVAEAIGVSHVYLADVERGVRSARSAEHELKLLGKIVGLNQLELNEARELSAPIGCIRNSRMRDGCIVTAGEVAIFIPQSAVDAIRGAAPPMGALS